MFNDMLLQHGIGKGGGSPIKSVQRGRLNDPTEIPINTVDLNYSIVRLLGYGGFYDIEAGGIPIIQFKDASTLQVKCGIDSLRSYVKMLSWEVIEFKPSAIKSLQKGIHRITVGDTTINVNQVATDKSMVFYQDGFSYTSSPFNSYDDIMKLSVHLSNGNSIAVYTHPYNGTLLTRELHWQLVEFK